MDISGDITADLEEHEPRVEARRLRERGLIKVDARQRLCPGFIDAAELTKAPKES